MYYTSNKNHNDYYNSYKKEIAALEAHRKDETNQKIIKLILSLLTLILFIMAFFYLYKYINPLNEEKTFLKQEEIFSKNGQLLNIVIREEELPQSIQMSENIQYASINKTEKVKPNIHEEDIALIVQLIVSELRSQTEKSLEDQLQEVHNKIFKNKKLEELNHYNKIIITDDEVIEIKNDSLLQLTYDLNRIIDEEVNSNSHYTQAISKEIIFRQNEMRVIVVQRGDTLSKIAKKAYGRYADYEKIFIANPEIIKNPNQIFVGQHLRIPS